MKRRTITAAAFGVFILSVFWSGCETKTGGSSDVRDFQKGVAFTGYSRSAYEGEDVFRSLDELQATNATWVSLLVTGYQETIHSTAVSIDGTLTPTGTSLEDFIAYARQKGLKVLLKPHVDCLDSRWRGEIGLAFTPADWTAWFSAYKGFILHYAQIAARTDCELFSVGCELNQTVGHSAEWRDIITDVRTAFDGPLIYADDQAESRPDAIDWWDALDYIGQDAYPTLSPKEDPSVDDLVQGWLAYRAKLEALSVNWDKPLILTEIGYRSIRGGTVNPWDWEKEGPVDLDIQRKAYEAAFRMLADQSWLAGIFWWQWMPDPQHGGPTDTGYSPHGKPAEIVLRSWFTKIH